MIVNRKDLLRALQSVTAGLSSKENIDQSNCFCFGPGIVRTFNDEILCQHEVPTDFTGAIIARPLLEMLDKMPEDEITLTVVNNKLRIKGSGKRAEVTFDPNVILATGSVEVPDNWIELPPAFSDALGMVAEATEKETNTEFAFVHMTPDYLEACDYLQAIRYNVATGVKGSVMVRGTSCKAIKGMGVASACETKDWMHWKTFTGLVVSVRKDTREYPKIEEIFETPIKGSAYIPGSVGDVIQRATPFMATVPSGKQTICVLSKNRLTIRAVNANGWYEEVKDIDYDGPDTTFGISPKNISGALKFGLPCEITDSSLRIRGDAFIYALSLENV